MSDSKPPVSGEFLTLTVLNEPYRGEYLVKVLESATEKVVVTMPERGGTIVPLACGEVITISNDHLNYQGQVLNRAFGEVRTLTITAPGTLSLTGRVYGDNHGARFLAVTSGKGGVGKSTFTVNLALALASLNLKVCMVDVDLGTANLDLMFGLPVAADLGDLLDGKPLEEVLVPLSPVLTLLPGSSGVGGIANLNQWQMGRLLSSFNKLAAAYDIVLLDTGAGVSSNVTGFLQAADQVILVATPDPTAITDAYALLKVMSAKDKLTTPWYLVLNCAAENEARVMQANFRLTAYRHLGMMITFLGSIPLSRSIASSVKKQQPFLKWGGGEEARAYHQIARELAGVPQEKRGFLQRFQETLLGK